METFSALLAICAGNSPVSGEFPAQRPVTRSFDVFFDLRMNERLNEHSWGWWLGTTSRPLWSQSNDGSHQISNQYGNWTIGWAVSRLHKIAPYNVSWNFETDHWSLNAYRSTIGPLSRQINGTSKHEHKSCFTRLLIRKYLWHSFRNKIKIF